MGFGGELITDSLLNQHNYYILNIFLIPTDKYRSHPLSSKHVPLQLNKTIIEKQN